MSVPRRRWHMPKIAVAAPARLAVPIAAAIVLAVGLSIIDALPVGVFYDDGLYVILAKALATGQGYHWLNLPGAPAATHFPPGYPALLAAIWRVFPAFPANVFAFKAANAVLLALASAAMVLFLRRRFGFSAVAAAALSVAACLGVPMLALSTLVLSEPMFLALLIPALLYAEHVVEGERRTRDLIALGLLAGVATLVRAHGIALVAAAALALLLRRPTVVNMPQPTSARLRLNQAGTVLTSAVLIVVPWQLWVRANQGLVPEAVRGMYESYTSWLARGFERDGMAFLLHTSARTTFDTADLFAGLATPFAVSWSRVITLVALLALIVAGVRKTWRTAPTMVLFLGGYFAIVVAWPFAPPRFIYGIWPLILLVFVLGAMELASWVPRSPWTRTARALLLACSLFAAVGHVRFSARAYRTRAWSNLARREAATIRPVVLWTRSHTRPHDVIASIAEPAVYLYTGRLAVPAKAFTARDYFRPATVVESEAALQQILAAYRVDAVVVVGDSVRAAAQSMASRAAPVLVLRDSLVNGVVFAPLRSPLVSQNSER